MTKYTIHHFVTGTDPEETTVHGDDALHIWTDSDPQTDPADVVLDAPSNGWTWESNMSGWKKHPDPLDDYATTPSDITRLSPWETTLTDGYTRT